MSARLIDPAQHALRIGLVVNGIKGRNQIERARSVELGHVPGFKTDVLGSAALRLGACRLDGIGTEIEADEATGGERLGQQVHRAARAASDVQHFDALLEAVGQARVEWKDVLEARRHDGLPTLFGHDLVEAVVLTILCAPAVRETLGDVILDTCHHRDPLAGRGHVVRAGCTGQPGRVLLGKNVGLILWVMLDEAGGDHRAQPLTDITLVQLGPFRDLRARGGGQVRHLIEQSGAMADGGHQGDGRVVEHAEHFLGESLRLRLVDLRGSQLRHCLAPLSGL